MSVAELKERHKVATETVNSLRERLKQKRVQLLDTDGWCFSFDPMPFFLAFEVFIVGFCFALCAFCG